MIYGKLFSLYKNRGDNILSKIYAYRGDYLPLFGQLINQIGLPQIINEIAAKPNSQARIDTGTMIAGMIMNILSDNKMRLYHLPHFFEDKPMPLLFPWNTSVNPVDFTEDRAGDVLDELFKAGPHMVFSSITRQNIQLFNIDTSTLRVDTTSKNFYGVYDTDQDSVIDITYGFSKDKHPELKQIMFGTATSADGVPILGEVMSGNTSDMTFNNRWIKNVRQALQKNEDDFLLYTADSAAVTDDNLKLLKKYHVDIISRLPGRYDLTDELMNHAIIDNNWVELGTFSENKKAATYKSISYENELIGNTYRFVVVHSSVLNKKKLKTLNSKKEKEKRKLDKLTKEISKREFFCQNDAEIEIKKFEKKNIADFHITTPEIIEIEKTIRRNKRGRPKKGEIPVKETRYIVKFESTLDKKVYAIEKEKCGLFILITTLMDVDEYPDKEILSQYKGQQSVENIFKFLKDPTFVGAYCLKSPERIVAFGYILLMAAQIYTILERQVRKVLANPDEKPIEGLNRIKTRKPTTYAIKHILSPILIVRKQNRKSEYWTTSGELNENQKRILKLAGFDEKIYQYSISIKNVEE